MLALKEESKNKKSMWYLDNGACNHMTSDRSKFMKIDSNIGGHITFGDSSKMKIKDKGIILIQSKNNSHKILSDIYYIPKLRSNILSPGQLLDREGL